MESSKITTSSQFHCERISLDFKKVLRKPLTSCMIDSGDKNIAGVEDKRKFEYLRESQ